MQRATKIVATIGPASSDRGTLTRMIVAGVDVVRLNFSHGKAQDHIDRAMLVREVADACGRTVAIMADLQGRRFASAKFEQGKIMLAPATSSFSIPTVRWATRSASVSITRPCREICAMKTCCCSTTA